MKSLRRIFNNKWLRYAAFGAAGAILASLFFQEVIIKRKEEEKKFREQAYKEKSSASEKQISELKQQLSRKEKQVIIRIIRPDGTVEEKIVTERVEKAVSQARAEVESTYRVLLEKKDKEFQSKLSELSVHRNPKRIEIFIGNDLQLEWPQKPHLVGGFNYQLVGPITIGALIGADGLVAPTLGIRF